MFKKVCAVSGIQRIMDEHHVDATTAKDMQDDFMNDLMANLHRAHYEVEAISGSPEQGIVLMFKDVND